MLPTKPMPPAAGGAPGGPPGADAGGPPPSVAPMHPAMRKVPPSHQQHLKPGDPMQGELLQRVDNLSPQDLNTLAQGISPQAQQVLKKALPEIGFLIDMLGQRGGGQQPPAPGGAPPPPGGAAPAMPPSGSGAMPQPTTKLAQMG